MADLGDREPFTSREAAVIAAIGLAFAPADATHAMTSRQTSATGVCLSGWLTNRIAVKAVLRALPMNQSMILWFRFAKDQTQMATAKHYNLSLNTVRMEEVAGIQTMIRIFWQEPGYVSGPRVRRPNPLEALIRASRAG